MDDSHVYKVLTIQTPFRTRLFRNILPVRNLRLIVGQYACVCVCVFTDSEALIHFRRRPYGYRNKAQKFFSVTASSETTKFAPQR